MNSTSVGHTAKGSRVPSTAPVTASTLRHTQAQTHEHEPHPQQSLPPLAELPSFLVNHPLYAEGWKGGSRQASARGQTSSDAWSHTGKRGRSLLLLLRDPAALRELLVTPSELVAREHNISEREVAELLAWAGQRCTPLLRPTTLAGRTVPVAEPRRVAEVFDVSAALAPIPTGLSRLDRHLRGGLRRRSLVELTGAAGAGMTRLALQWAASAVGCDERMAVLWMHTSPAASVEAQVLALLDARVRASAGSAPGEVEGLRQRLQLVPVTTNLEDFYQLQLKLLERHVADAGAQARVGLVVIDNLSQLVHRSHSGLMDKDNVERQSAIAALMQDLKRLAVSQDVCVLLLTHGSRGGGDGGGEGAPGEFGRVLLHAVNVRLRLRELLWTIPHRQEGSAHRPRPHQDVCGPCEMGRELRVVKSPLCGPVVVHLRNDAGGSDAFGTATEVSDAEEEQLQVASNSHVDIGDDLATALDPADYQVVPTFVFT